MLESTETSQLFKKIPAPKECPVMHLKRDASWSSLKNEKSFQNKIGVILKWALYHKPLLSHSFIFYFSSMQMRHFSVESWNLRSEIKIGERASTNSPTLSSYLETSKFHHNWNVCHPINMAEIINLNFEEVLLKSFGWVLLYCGTQGLIVSFFPWIQFLLVGTGTLVLMSRHEIVVSRPACLISS